MSRPEIHWIIPTVAAIASVVPSYGFAVTYMSVEQAQHKMLPGVSLQKVNSKLTAVQMNAIKKSSGVRVLSPDLNVWKAADGHGWFYLDKVIGKHEFITYAVAIGTDGAVRDIEILDYRETYGDQIRNAKWRAQFTGKRVGAPLKLDVDIVNISSATLSCRHIADGVKRLLTTHDIVVRKI